MLVLGARLSSRVLAGPPLDAAGQMALDEAVLDSAAPGELVLRVYHWAGPACTFGYSQRWKDAKEACDDRWEGVSPVRRATGGGVVFHDGDITFSLIFPWDRALAPETVYKNVHRGIHEALKAAGQTARLHSPERAPAGVAAACFARPERMDLVDDAGRKLLGGALRKRASKGLYQGSLRPELLELTRERIAESIAAGAAREFGREPSLELRPGWLEAARALEARYRSAEWNERR